MMMAIAAGLAAGALWSLAFIAPGLIHPFTASDLTLFRYAVFGVSSLLLLAARPRIRWWPLAKLHWRRLATLALTGNTLYYLMLSEALQRLGTLLPTLIIGTLPVIMALAGGLRGQGFSARRFTLPALLILGGLTTHVGLWRLPYTISAVPPDAAIGLVLPFAALASWTFYGLWNAEFLSKNRDVDILSWTALMGVATLSTLLPVMLVVPGRHVGFWNSTLVELRPLLLWGAVLGLLSSWLATWLWNKASRFLSGQVLGYLIISETIFAIIFAFLLDGRWPTPAELSSMGLLICGICLGVRNTSVQQ